MKRIKEIDGLRSLAALLVISFHYFNNTLNNTTNSVGRLINKIFSFGWVGVDLFFVLSGFLIGSILFANTQSKNYYKVFYLRRFVRIIPNYYLLLILYLIISNIPFFYNNTFIMGTSIIPFWSYFLMLHNIFMGQANNLGTPALTITWSIGIEEQFYLFIPFLVRFVSNKYFLKVLGLFVIIAIVARGMYSEWIPRYVFLYCRIDSLSVGLAIAWLRTFKDLKSFVAQHNTIIKSILLIDLLICGFCYYKFGDLGVFKHTLFAIIFGIMILYAIAGNENSVYAKFLRLKPLTFLGSLSYSLYLFHYLILGITFQILTKHNPQIVVLKDVGVVFVALAATFIFSYLVYKFLEEPVMALGKKYKY